jgi:hypothetical protein
MSIGFAIIIASMFLGWALSGSFVAQVMERWNSRLGALLTGIVVPIPCVLLGALVATLFFSETELATGGIFAIGLFAIFASGFSVVVGGLIGIFISIGMWQPEDTVWISEDGDERGYRSREDDERYG